MKGMASKAAKKSGRADVLKGHGFGRAAIDQQKSQGFSP
jgi:hypothetical protein